MEEQLAFLRLVVILFILVLAVVLAMVYFPDIPLIGMLPGDFEIDLPGATLFLPITSSIILSAILTLIAYLVQRHSQK